jgi:predicted nucleic acid-binding protein
VTDKVIDASAICAVVFNESKQSDVERRLHAVRLHAPALIDFEVASTCLKKIRSRPADQDDVMRLYNNFQNFTISKAAIDLTEAVVLAEQFNLSAYDASYLWLARELGAELVTLDARLERAAAALQSSS